MYEKMEVRVVCLMVSSVDTERVLSEGWRWREVIHRLLEQASYSHLLIDGAMGVKIKQQIFCGGSTISTSDLSPGPNSFSFHRYREQHALYQETQTPFACTMQ